MTCNCPVQDWGEWLRHQAVLMAMLDRLVHRRHVSNAAPRRRDTTISAETVQSNRPFWTGTVSLPPSPGPGTYLLGLGHFAGGRCYRPYSSVTEAALRSHPRSAEPSVQADQYGVDEDLGRFSRAGPIFDTFGVPSNRYPRRAYLPLLSGHSSLECLLQNWSRFWRFCFDGEKCPPVVAPISVEHPSYEALEDYARNAVNSSDVVTALEEHLLVCKWCRLRLRKTDQLIAILRHALAEFPCRSPSCMFSGSTAGDCGANESKLCALDSVWVDSLGEWWSMAKLNAEFVCLACRLCCWVEELDNRGFEVDELIRCPRCNESLGTFQTACYIRRNGRGWMRQMEAN